MSGAAVIVGIGLDAVELDRFARSLARTPGLRARLFTEAELDEATRRRDPVERLAGRFAVKEAVMKVFGVGLGACAFRDVETVRAESGAPQLRLHGRAAVLAAERGIHRWHLSITHTERTAIASVVGEAVSA